MRDVILITPQAYGIEAIVKSLPENTSYLVNSEEQRVTVYLLGTELSVEFIIDESMINYYENKEIDLIKKIIKDPKFIIVHFKKIEALSYLLNFVANSKDILIDNDFGIIESGLDFLQRFKENSDWDWINT
ncbi:hypothetical protein [Delftia acidovorans]|uniref:hypothetical protein n=1 Tax=Delftia acidovorans TaxID=80866 RepID=UPI002FDE3C12